MFSQDVGAHRLVLVCALTPLCPDTSRPIRRETRSVVVEEADRGTRRTPAAWMAMDGGTRGSAPAVARLLHLLSWSTGGARL